MVLWLTQGNISGVGIKWPLIKFAMHEHHIGKGQLCKDDFFFSPHVSHKRIVSRDWGGLLLVLLD
jgi:hypothetical protein